MIRLRDTITLQPNTTTIKEPSSILLSQYADFSRKLNESRYAKWVILTLSLAMGAGLFVWFFMRLSTDDNTFGIDLIFYALRDWNIHYDVSNGLRNPPWSVLILVPMGTLLPDRASWGLLAFFTLVGLVASVPRTERKWVFYTSVFLIVSSIPTLRVVVDAQLEILVIGGILAVVYGLRAEAPLILAVGSLFATAKPQAVFLLMPIVGLYMLLNWNRTNVVRTVALVGLVVIPTAIWRGAEWIDAVNGTYQAGSLIDIGLGASMRRTEAFSEPIIALARLAVLIATACIIWISERTISSEKATLLVTSSLLLAPYAAGNSVLIVLAVGVLPLLQRRFWLGLLMFVIADIYLYFNRPSLAEYISYYWTAFLLLSWVIFTWDILRTEVITLPTLKKAAIEPMPETGS